MIHGLDTSFLVAAEVTEHAEHAGAQDTLARLLSAGDFLALAPQVLAEFIHIVTDSRRFAQPLDMARPGSLRNNGGQRVKSCACSLATSRLGNFSPGCYNSR